MKSPKTSWGFFYDFKFILFLGGKQKTRREV